MGKKQVEPVHIGKRSFWSGKVTTLCGLVFAPGKEKQENWLFTRVSCRDCLAVRKGGRR